MAERNPSNSRQANQSLVGETPLAAPNHEQDVLWRQRQMGEVVCRSYAENSPIVAV